MAYLERKSTRLRADLNEMLDHMGLVTCTQHPSKCSRMHIFFFLKCQWNFAKDRTNGWIQVSFNLRRFKSYQVSFQPQWYEHGNLL